MIRRRAAGGSGAPRGKIGKRKPEAAPKAGKGVRRRSASKRARGEAGKGDAKSGPQPNRRKQPPKRQAAKPPRPSLRQRLRVARERASGVWERIRRPAMVAAKVAVALVVALGAVGVAKLIERHLRTSPAFAARELSVEGHERLTRGEVLRAAGLARGQNVFEVAPEDARERLLRHPWIAEAEVERRLPDTLGVRVREHRAAALLALEGVVYLVSDEGAVFKRAGAEDPADLPVVTGIPQSRFVSDEAWRTSLLIEVVALMHDYRSAGLWRREPIGEVFVEPDDGLTLYIGDDATVVRLGHGPYRTKLAKLRRVVDRLQGKDRRAAHVYLDNVRRPDRVTVRLR